MSFVTLAQRDALLEQSTYASRARDETAFFCPPRTGQSDERRAGKYRWPRICAPSRSFLPPTIIDSFLLGAVGAVVIATIKIVQESRLVHARPLTPVPSQA